MSKDHEFTFSDKYIYPDRQPPSPLIQYRNHLYNKFSRHIGLLLEAKNPRQQHTNKGRLDGRRAYRFPFSENIFKTYKHIPSSDTTFILLIDGSGSMQNWGDTFENRDFTRIEVANAISSAFGKALRDVGKDEIKIEVFVKSAPCISSPKSFVRGEFVTLTRVMSNANSCNTKSFDRVLSTSCNSPTERIGDRSGSMGSATPEFAVLGGLVRWMRKNVKTKNAIIVNLTDGETYCSVGENGHQFRGVNTKELGTKYLRGIPNTTLIIGKCKNRREYEEIYRHNVIFTDDGFEAKLFSTLVNLVQSSYE